MKVYNLIKEIMKQEKDELFKDYLTEEEIIQLKNEIHLIESPNER